LSGGKANGCEVDNLYLFSRLRVGGVIRPLIHFAFMACVGTTLPEPWPARSLLTVVTKLSRFCYFVFTTHHVLFYCGVICGELLDLTEEHQISWRI